MHRIDAWRMIKARARAIGLPEKICCHTFRGTGLTTYLEGSGTLEHAQKIANQNRQEKAYDAPRTRSTSTRSRRSGFEG